MWCVFPGVATRRRSAAGSARAFAKNRRLKHDGDGNAHLMHPPCHLTTSCMIYQHMYDCAGSYSFQAWYICTHFLKAPAPWRNFDSPNLNSAHPTLHTPTYPKDTGRSKEHAEWIFSSETGRSIVRPGNVNLQPSPSCMHADVGCTSCRESSHSSNTRTGSPLTSLLLVVPPVCLRPDQATS